MSLAEEDWEFFNIEFKKKSYKILKTKFQINAKILPWFSNVKIKYH